MPDWIYIEFYFHSVNLEAKVSLDFASTSKVSYIRQVQEVDVTDEDNSIEGWDWDPYMRQLNLIINGKFSAIDEKDLVRQVNSHVACTLEV